jgi:hypothetical protein
MTKEKPQTLLEVFTGGNYGLDPAPMVWVDAASTRESQPILACPHCQYLHEWMPSSWICTRCNGRVIPPPPAGGSGDILTAEIRLLPKLGSSSFSLEHSGHTSLSTTYGGITVSIFDPSTASLRQIAEVCLAEVARREGQP